MVHTSLLKGGGGVTRLKASADSESQIVPECNTCARLSIFPGHSSTTSSSTAVLSTRSPSSTTSRRACCCFSAASRPICSVQLKLTQTERPPSASSERSRLSPSVRPSCGSGSEVKRKLSSSSRRPTSKPWCFRSARASSNESQDSPPTYLISLPP